jgi:hypothetical protein
VVSANTTTERTIGMYVPHVSAPDLVDVSDLELATVHDNALQALCAWSVENQRRTAEREAEAERERQRRIRDRLEASKYAPLRVSSRTPRPPGRPYPMYRPSPSPATGGTTEGEAR